MNEIKNLINKAINLFNNNKKVEYSLYAIVLLIVGIMLYFINYNYLHKTIHKKERKLIKLQKEYKRFLKDVKTASAQMVAVKKTYDKKQKQYSFLKDDMKYIKYKMNISSLKIKEGDFYNILDKILKNASKNNLNIDYDFYVDANKSLKITKYIIDMRGSFECEKYKNFENFIVNVSSLNIIKSFENVNIIKNNDNNLSFDISLFIWSIQ